MFLYPVKQGHEKVPKPTHGFLRPRGLTGQRTRTGEAPLLYNSDVSEDQTDYSTRLRCVTFSLS